MGTPRGIPSVRRGKAVAPTDLATDAYHHIRKSILDGRLAPGTRIVESDLADRLAISRTPVRAALQRLQQEGWVVGSGAGRQLRLSVSPITQDDARELFDIIGCLEGLAARSAARLPAAERTRLAAQLRAVNEELRAEAASAQPDPYRVYDLHSAFHVQLVGALHAPRLHVLHSAIKPQAYRYRQVYSVALVPAAVDAAAEHDEVLRGIESGDPGAAELAARTNWANAAERMGRIIRTWGEKGSW